jgi:hypothetical protein
MKSFLKNTSIILAIAGLAAGCRGKTDPVTSLPPSNIPTQTPTIPPAPTTTDSGKPPQFIVMAFDGSYSLPMWKNTLDFSKQMNDQGNHVHFTYFLSGVYFLNFRKASRYQPPQKPAGTSLIGFGESNLDIEKRVANVNRAIAGGHEIGSHVNGHFDGSKWSVQDWQQEFSQFNKLIFHIAENNDVSPEDAAKYTLQLKPSDVIGFRAPELGHNDNLWSVLAENNFKYDTSLSAAPDQWPKKMNNGLWEFPLARIQYATTTGSLLSMDYNFYFKQSKALDIAKKGDPVWNKFYNDTYTSYYNYFEHNYTGNRAPVFIGSHFSQWNDGVYWETMKNFAATTCTQPEVRCVTFKELLQYLEEHPQTK